MPLLGPAAADPFIADVVAHSEEGLMSVKSAAPPKARPGPVDEQEARQVAESARETEWVQPSFVRELFLGNLRLDLIHPPPAQDPAEKARAAEFHRRLYDFALTVDGEAIERTGRVPDDVVQGLRDLGAFGIKIPQEYGGLGLSQRSYNTAIATIGSAASALGVLLSAHQSIGLPQPLKMFGTPEQKKKYLPRLAGGEISAFALTEPDVGSDPARMAATAEPTDDGSAYILNGEKLWCTNGPIADVMVVMARTPPRPGSTRRGITAFIVEADSEGVENTHRLEFMGLRGIENGVVRFTNVRVPRENIIWGEGKGLKLALTTLNTGRLTIPATTAASAKWCVKVAREWAAVREQWGAPVGKHDAVAQMLGRMAATTFAMEGVNDIAAGLADAGNSDIRLEAAIAKMYNSEGAWRVVDDCMQIRGGRGYETAASLQARGEEPIPLERLMRDLRINLIFEGSSEIMRLFIAREAVDPHLQRAGAMADPKAGRSAKLRGMAGLGLHMAAWVPGLLVGKGRLPGAYGEFGGLAKHLRFVERASRKLGRTLFLAMTRYGPKLEKRQSVLFRLVDVGAELFAMSCACVHAQRLMQQDPSNRGPGRLADLFCRHSRRRVKLLFSQVFDNDDAFTYRAAQEVLQGRHAWLDPEMLV
jgi:alkylation response protein AidB-like acyl-CoA dehydrogenase